MRWWIAVFVSLAGCATVQPDAPQGSAVLMPAGKPSPQGARIERSGYATILSAPPSPFPAEAPPMPGQLDTLARRTSLGTDADRNRAWEEVNGTAAFQLEFQRLREVIARAESDTFLTVRLVRDPGVIGEFLFSGGGKETLAKYTDDKAFRAVDTSVDPIAFGRLEQTWLGRTEIAEASINLLGANSIDGTIEMNVGIEEPAFRAIAARRGWDLTDPRLRFTFAQPRPEPFAVAGLAGLVRAFPRENTSAAIRLLAKGTGTVVLKDGCFRHANDKGRAGDTLVMFARDSQLTLDGEGYLAIRSEGGERQYRIGELGSWGGPNGFSESDEDVRALREACGRDRLINLAAPQSERLFAMPEPLWVLDYAYSKGITYDAAWDRVTACMNRQMDRGRMPMEARDRCIQQYNGWDYTGDTLPPPPGQ